MSSKISASDIRNVHIYNETTDLRELNLCRKHRLELSDLMADRIDDLVATRLFQSQFKEFLPNPNSNEEVHVKIRITGREIIVQKVNQQGSSIGQSQKVNLNRVENHDDREEAEEINQSILRSASRIYQRHLNESSRRDRSISPLRRRTTRHKRREREHDRFRSTEKRIDHHKSHRDRSVSRSSDRHSNQRRREKPSVRSASPTFTKRHSLSDHQKESERSISPERHSDQLRHETKRSRHIQQSHQNPHAIETELDLYQSKIDSTAKRESGPSNHPVDQRLSHMDQRLRNLEEKLLSNTSPLPATPLNSKREEHPPLTKGNLLLPKMQPAIPSSEELNQLKVHKRELEQKLEEISSENQFLKTPLPKITSSTSSADFNTLIQLSRDLSSADVSGSTYFPEHLKVEFMKLPEAIRYDIYYQTYLLVDPSESLEPWPIGQKLFEDTTSSDKAMNLCRAHAIRHFLLLTLANDFAKNQENIPPHELLNRFAQLSEEDQRAVYKQLELRSPKGSHHNGSAYAFNNPGKFSATNQERGIAIHRVIFDRIAEYHRHHYRESIKAMEKIFREAYEKLKRDSQQPT